MNKRKSFNLFKRKKDNVSQKEIKIKFNNLQDLTTTKELYLGDIQDLTEEEINNFIYINPLATIELSPVQGGLEKSCGCYDETSYVNSLIKILNILKLHNRTYNINIRIENRELLKQSGILNIPNINFTIWNDCYKYKQEEYLKEEEQLDKIALTIQETNLSTYEKYLAAYNIVKQFKKYKENKKNKDQARFLRYILNNEYMVCVGYAKLLKTLLDKLSIPSIQVGVEIDTSYDKGYSKENIPTKLSGHERLIIKIDDEKWNIHGVYVSDPTWDNDLEYDLYNNSAITFDKKKEAKRLEQLNDYDLLLDFHNMDEFINKLNYYLKRKIKVSYKQSFQDKIIHSYKMIYDKIIDILIELDYPKYMEFINKYEALIKDIIYGKISNFQTAEEIFINFLTDYALYIIPLSNRKISDTVLYSATKNVKIVLDGYTKDEIKEWNRETKKMNQIIHSFSFPYSYNPKETRKNYLNSRGKIKIKTKSN